MIRAGTVKPNEPCALPVLLKKRVTGVRNVAGVVVVDVVVVVVVGVVVVVVVVLVVVVVVVVGVVVLRVVLVVVVLRVGGAWKNALEEVPVVGTRTGCARLPGSLPNARFESILNCFTGGGGVGIGIL